MRLHKTLLSLGALLAAVTITHAEVKVGQSFPDLSKYKLDGQLPADLKGKVVIVDFWASWCGPCRESFPVMDGLQKKYGPQGLVIIAVNEDEKKSEMDDFRKDNPTSFTIVRDAGPDGKKLVDKVEISVMPSSFVIDGEGKVRFTHSGFHGSESKKKYEQEIETLLKK